MEYGEESFANHVLWCDPKKRPKHRDPYAKEYPVSFTDSVIKATMKKFGICGAEARNAIINVAKNYKQAVKKHQLQNIEGA